jgi:SSS family solute:Na+ symporter
MTILISVSLIMAAAGGLVTIIATNCVEGIVSQVLYLVIIFGLLSIFGWPQIKHVMAVRPPGQSLLNPFDSMGLKDFNIWYILMWAFLNAYGIMAWQNQSGFNGAALTAHESVMGGILGRWREAGKGAILVLLGVCTMTYLQHPDFAAASAPVRAAVNQLSNPEIRHQAEMPLALAHFLPAGLKGSLCVIFLMAGFCGEGQHLHSWGSLFVQDVLLPLRKKPLSPGQHIRWLRLSMAGVALFAILFGALFRQMEYIQMWWVITTAIYVGGAGVAIIGGLYWARGTTAGAWVALITGSVLSAGGILVREIYGTSFPLNPMQISFFASLAAIVLYAGISLLTNREDFNMERMLHRGKYAQILPKVGEADIQPARRRLTWGKLIGFDHNFTLGDKWVAGSFFGWNMAWFFVFLIGTVWNFFFPWPTRVWAIYWHVTTIGIPVFLAVAMAIWFTWGGLRDMRALFQRLKQQKVNPLDNGMVINHQNLDETSLNCEPKNALSPSLAAHEP